MSTGKSKRRSFRDMSEEDDGERDEVDNKSRILKRQQVVAGCSRSQYVAESRSKSQKVAASRRQSQ